MTATNLEDEKRDFLDEEFIASSIRGALGHAKIYRSRVSEKERRKLRGVLRTLLRTYARDYKESEVSDTTHTKNIEEFARKVSQASECRDVLKDEFRIGVAQKALNLYLKYLWCMGWIPKAGYQRKCEGRHGRSKKRDLDEGKKESDLRKVGSGGKGRGRAKGIIGMGTPSLEREDAKALSLQT